MDVTNAVVAACKEHAGKGPPRAKAYVAPDTVYVVLGDWMTRAERTLMAQGSQGLVAEMRSTLHDRIADATRTAVEAATGRTVLAVQTQIELSRNVATVQFILSPAGE